MLPIPSWSTGRQACCASDAHERLYGAASITSRLHRRPALVRTGDLITVDVRAR
jgi:hypothetical protein